jgi:CRISPR-associated protein Cmr4
MYHSAHPLFIVCETPMHAGSGDDLGIVDLPIQRERHTAYPKIEGSSLKGALREAFEQKLGKKDAKLLAAFGPESDDSGDNTYASCLGFSDARILLFPVKSMKGVFAWVTCPHVLNRLNNDLQHTGLNLKIENIPMLAEGEAVINSNASQVRVNEKHVLLEEYAYELVGETSKIVVGNEPLEKWLANSIFGTEKSYWKDKLEMDLVILNDNDFKAFVEHSTEVVTRIRIDNQTGTVADGQLFTEEFLPSESIMYSLVLSSPSFKREGDVKIFKEAEDSTNFFENTLNNNLKNVLQVGGDATIGKGIVRATLLK